MACNYITAKEVVDRYKSFLIGLPLNIKGVTCKINHLIISTQKEFLDTFFAYCNNNYDNEKALQLTSRHATDFNIYVIHYNIEEKKLWFIELRSYLNNTCNESNHSSKGVINLSSLNMGIKRTATRA